MTRQHRKRQWLALAGFLALAFLCAGIGALATSNAREFYAALVKPEWAPPGSVFAPVWTTLFFLMGVAAWLVWRARGWNGALTLFCAQLVANALWSWLFFAWQRGALAFVEVLVLWAMIAATLLAFWRIRPLAGALLVPYLAWVTFASALTWATWQRNPALLG